MFFKHFASKNQLPGLSISGTLVENVLNHLFCLTGKFQCASQRTKPPKIRDSISCFPNLEKVCCTTISKSSTVNSASLSQEEAAISRAYCSFYSGPMASVSYCGTFCPKCILFLAILFPTTAHAFVNFSNNCRRGL